MKNSNPRSFNIIEGKHYTFNGLVAYLNQNFSKELICKQKKVTKMSYNSNDIHQYVRRGELPKYLGGAKIKEITVPFMELKLLEITWPKK